VYYKAKDAYSEFTEHEVDDVLVAELKDLPNPNFEFAYGYSLVTKEELKNKNSRLYKNLAPWVVVMIEKKLI
jgi:isopentenyldiphosphate isomerase